MSQAEQAAAASAAITNLQQSYAQVQDVYSNYLQTAVVTVPQPQNLQDLINPDVFSTADFAAAINNLKLATIPEADLDIEALVGEAPDSAEVRSTITNNPAIKLVDEFKQSEPTITDIKAPDKFAATNQKLLDDIRSPVELSLPTVPAEPTLPVVTAPKLSDVSIPSLSNPDLPVFDGTLVDTTLTAPAVAFTYAEPIYTSVQLNALVAKLSAELQNGGYGIEVADERQIWERERDREALAATQRLDEVKASIAALGYRQPPGAMQAAIIKATQDSQAKAASASRETAIKRADMFVENRKFTIQTTLQLQQFLADTHNKVQDRILKAAEVAVSSAVQIFNSAVQAYNTRLERYKTQAQVFEARMRAAAVQVEINTQQLEAAKTKVGINKELVELFRAQLAANKDRVEIYQATLGAVKVKSDLELAKLEQRRLQVTTLQGLAQAYASEVNAYKAEVDGQQSKLSLFKTQIDGYQAKASSVKTFNEALIQRVEQSINLYKLDLEAYKERIETAKLRLQVSAEVSRNIVAQNAQTLDATKLSTLAVTEASKANAEYAKANIAVAEATDKIAVTVAEVQQKAITDELTRSMKGADALLDSITYQIGAYSASLQGLAVKQE